MEPEKAEFPGTCYLCGTPILVGDEIQRWHAAGVPVAAHVSCVEENIRGGQEMRS